MRLTGLLSTAALLVATLPLAFGARDTCTSGIRVRKEFRDLTTAERTNFLNAVRRAMSATPRPNHFDNLCRTHQRYNRVIHGIGPFLAWHRAFTRMYERLLQSYDSRVMLPYWDWTVDSQAPERSIIFSSSNFGGRGGRNGCVTTGVCAGLTVFPASVSSPRCVRRGTNPTLGAYYSRSQLQALLNQATSYEALRQRIEGVPHGSVHNSIGGDMTTMNSPCDPLFFLHHGFIDFLWAQWQAKSASYVSSYNCRNPNGSSCNLNDRLVPYSYFAGDVSRTSYLCYTYQQYSRSSFVLRRRSAEETSPESIDDTVSVVPSNCTLTKDALLPDPDDRTELYAIRPTKPLPEEWVKANHLKVCDIRAAETKQRADIVESNSKTGCLDDSALIRHPGILKKLLADNPNAVLTATRGGKRVKIQFKKTCGINDDLLYSVEQKVNAALGLPQKTSKPVYFAD